MDAQDHTGILPGCRTHGRAWADCKFDIQEFKDHVTIRLETTETAWTRNLKRHEERIRCNLQEFALLRRITEDYAVNKTEFPWEVLHLPQERYFCLFPHDPAEAHEVLEIIPSKSEDQLQELGRVAIDHSAVILCPAPASTCQNRHHFDVRDKVCKLAVHWPVRQIISSAPERRMIDITPVAICRHNPDDDGCISVFQPCTKTAPLHLRIEPCQPLLVIKDWFTHGWIPNDTSVNPELALHETWNGKNPCATQTEVLRGQDRRAEVLPTRLYDAVTREAKPNTTVTHYLALSYCWYEWSNEDLLKQKIAELHERLKIRYFWIDRWCIDQKDKNDKAREIPRMAMYYTGASGCVVLAGPTVQPFKCLPMHSGAILAPFQQILLNIDALSSLVVCPWVTRVWTIQEAMMSRQIVFAIADQLVDGDFISELIARTSNAGATYVMKEDGKSCYVGGYSCYNWNPAAPAVICPWQVRSQKGSRQLILIRTLLGGKRQFQMLQESSRLVMPFEEAITLLVDRFATIKEDYVYGILGLVERAENIKIEYDIGWPAMLAKLQEAKMLTDRQFAAPDVSVLSWLQAPDSNEYGPLKRFERLAGSFQRPTLSWSHEGAIVQGVLFEWRSPRPEWRGTHNIWGEACYCVSASIELRDGSGLVARVSATSSTAISQERLNGKHILLCEGVDENTRATIAIKVEGEIETGKVCRIDGYVLEIYDWGDGNPSALQRKQWLITEDIKQ